MDSLMSTQSSMEVEICVEEENVGTNNSIKEEVKKDEGVAFKEKLEDEMDSLNEEEIWRSQRERINNALAAARNAERQDPAEVYAAAHRLEHIMFTADVEEFVSEIEKLANQTDLSASFNCLSPSGTSLLHLAANAGKDDILRLLLDYVPVHLIAAQNDNGNTPLHLATGAKRPRATAILIRRTRDLPNMEDKKKILRMKNKRGNTALHEAVLNGHVEGVGHLLNEDLETVYWKNEFQSSPLYLAAVESKDPAIHDVLFSLQLDPSRIQGLPPIQGAIMRARYDLATQILEKNGKLFEMTDSRGGNVFHLAAYMNMPRVFELLGPKTVHLAVQPDMNGDLPIHIASKMGYVELIKKLLPVPRLWNGRGQTVLHVAAKYGRTSAVRYMLRHPELRMLINDVDRAGNTASHLAAMYSQPAALIPLVMDERFLPGLINHECLTAFDIALDRFRKEPTLRKQLTLMVLSSSTIGKGPAISGSLLLLRPEARDEAFSIFSLRKKKVNPKHVKDLINARLLVATLVATVTFAAGFAIPGGFNGSDTAFKDDRGMATMLDKRLFQAFAICNTISMFCSMTTVINLIYAQQHDVEVAIAAVRRSVLPLIIALPAMSIAFLTGVTLTVEYPTLLRSDHRPIRRLIYWLILAYIYFWGVQTYLLDDLEDDKKINGTSASQPSDGSGAQMTDDSATTGCGDAPHPPSH
ncbi:hypothetical protein NL676_028540 [Syzygium grande]|nr:hypothetical protein NL676_028540 [Syzygium grande]